MEINCLYLLIFLHLITKSEKENLLSLQQRDTKRLRDRKRERQQRDGTQAVRQGGGEHRLRENQRQRDRGLERETKSERGAREKMVYVYSIRCHK